MWQKPHEQSKKDKLVKIFDIHINKMANFYT